ncbi:MAG: imidazole glycerol phosphate synthase subunit HisF [Cyclobacteriaceae bacterium]|jgi:cyclase|nr:imidazole glycerol phosphate synthase subunit HisF [Cyclobacteriaceae bacterium]
MLAKRIIPCLDIKDGRTVKGINFENMRDAGDPVALGEKYAKEGADELVFLDISATQEQRKTFASLVNEIARHLNIPFTVGGGISSIADAEKLLEAGADKVSINSSAVYNPDLINEMAKAFGSQFVVVAIDAKKEINNWVVHTHGGKKATDKRLYSWALETQERGAGEILFTSMNHDGAKQGFANEALEKLHHALQIPVIASGGAGDYGHFMDVFTLGKADAALAASVFHFGEISVPQLKSYLRSKLISVR